MMNFRIKRYINWNFHEPERGFYDFSGDADFVKFIKLAQEMGFVVILRPGPFIDAEVDMVFNFKLFLTLLFE
jgi:beta-galactosidase GanA